MESVKKFALIGAAGFVAPRHMKAIKNTGNALVAAIDPHDCVGIMDNYFPEAAFFTEFERFDRHIDKLRRLDDGVDYVSICSPNYLHDAHIRFGLRNHANVICEKPLVLNPWNLEAIRTIEDETGKKVFTILQLRHHPVIRSLYNKFNSKNTSNRVTVDLTYITSRGKWYHSSWKGDAEKSGGIATNIGVHFFDMLIWVFGDILETTVHLHTHDRASGTLELERASVSWFLSIDSDTIPESEREKGKKTFRSIRVDGEELEFSDGFEDLHTESYKAILAGTGFGIADTEKAISAVHKIRTAEPTGIQGIHHELAELPVKNHPFKKQYLFPR